MSSQKLQCPICNQQFPAYDQRGFRNAGFTSHHNRCLERQQQQQNETQQNDMKSSRASRFAMAIRRRLLPAQPVSPIPINTTSQAHKRNSILSVLPGPGPGCGSGPSSSSPLPPSYGSHAHSIKSTAIITPTVPSQISLSVQQQPIPRQRHTWNHWNIGRETRRSVSNPIKDKAHSPSISPTRPRPRPIILPTTLPPHPLVSTTVSSDCQSLPLMDHTTKNSTFPLLTTMTTMDLTTALIIPQTTPTLMSNTPMNSPNQPVTSPFSFISMLTTLPLETAPLDPSSSVSASSINSNTNTNLCDSNDTLISRHQQSVYSSLGDQQGDLMASNRTTSNCSLGRNNVSMHLQHQEHNSQQVEQQQDRYHTLERQYYDQQNYSFPAQITNNNVYQLQNMTPLAFSPPTTNISSTAALTNSMHSPINLDPLHHGLTYCGYCQPQNGLHDPFCSLLEHIMADIMRGDGSNDS
ncbi:hypothetical protein BC941DRAFT_467207 [Chlamydoabsidia padenii]|nr:hypothetical protein BC941DRAFT_467207 [Chlamydoabsidia padenii]